MGDESAEPKGAVGRLDPVQPLDIAQAHEAAWTNQMLSHHGHERGAAGNDPRVLAMLTKDSEGFIEPSRGAILEGVHARLRSAAARIDSTIL
jgi:hypothetical protein